MLDVRLDVSGALAWGILDVRLDVPGALAWGILDVRLDVSGALAWGMLDVRLDVGGDVLTGVLGRKNGGTEGKGAPCSWFGTNLWNIEPSRETAQVVEQLFPEVDDMKSHAV